MSTKAKILIRGSILRITVFFANVIVGLMLMPFIIHSLGDKMYGLWIFVVSFLDYYGLFDFGLSSAIQRFVSRGIGGKDYEETNKVINTALFIYTIIGFIVLILSFAIAFVVPLLIKNLIEVNFFRKIVLILGLNFALGFPLRVFSGFLTANLRYDLSTSISLAQLIIRTILIVIFIRFGVLALAFITFFIDICGYTFKYFLARYFYKYITLSKKLVDKSKIKSLFSYSVYTFITQIADQLRFNIDNLVIVAFMGLNFVTIYSIAARLIQYFISFAWSACGIMMPVFSNYEAQNDYVAIREKFLLMTKTCGYLSILIGGMLLILGRAFIERWMGIEYLAAYPILVILVVAIIFDLMIIPTVDVVYGISKHKYLAMSNVIEGIANLILSIILVKKYGLIGVALGTAIPMLIIKIFVQPIYVCRFISLDLRKYFFGTIVPMILKSLIVFFVFFEIFHNFMLPNYINLLTLAFVNFILFAIAIFIIGLDKVERAYFKKVVFG